MTNKMRVLSRPPEVRQVLRIFMTRLSLDDPDPDWETYAGYALQLWQDAVDEGRPYISEVELAQAVMDETLQHEVWKRVLRARAN